MQTLIQFTKVLLLPIILLLILLTSCGPSSTLNKSSAKKVVASANNTALFSNTVFRIDGNAFIIEGKTNYTLTALPPKPEFDDQYGTFVKFEEDGTFQGYYSAPCGNDCFTDVKGTYKMLPKNQVDIFVLIATQDGECPSKTLVKDKKIGTFEILTDDKKNFNFKLI